MKIYQNNKLIWDSETRAEYTTGDAFTWLSYYLAKKVEKIEDLDLPACNYERDAIQNNIELYKIKLDLLSKIQDLLDNKTMEFVINFNPYNCFSRGTEYKIYA
jgi:hypothetical protein